MNVPPTKVSSHKDNNYKITDLRIPLANSGHALFVRENVRHYQPASTVATVGSSMSRTKHAFVMIVVHGGPGLADYAESYAGLQRLLDYEGIDCHAMVFYDQLGCGASDKPASFDYTLSYYTQELAQVVDFVKNRHGHRPICLLGHSWGGQVVLEYCARHGGRDSSIPIVSAIVSNSPLDESTYEQKQRNLRNLLADDVRQFLQEEELAQSVDGSVGSAIYSKLIGLNEASITGEMKGWSILHRLGDINVPCLFISGTDDSIPFDEYEVAAQHGHAVKIIPGAGHGPFFGPTADEYFRIIHQFLQTNLK